MGRCRSVDSFLCSKPLEWTRPRLTITWRIQQVVVAEILQQAFTAQRHGRIQLPVDDIEGLVDAGLAFGAETIDKGAPDVSALRAQTDCLEYILPGTNAAVEMHLDVITDFGHDFR